MGTTIQEMGSSGFVYIYMLLVIDGCLHSRFYVKNNITVVRQSMIPVLALLTHLHVHTRAVERRVHS